MKKNYLFFTFLIFCNLGNPQTNGIIDSEKDLSPNANEKPKVHKGKEVKFELLGDFTNQKILKKEILSTNYPESGNILVAFCINADGSVKQESVRVSWDGTNTTSLTLKKIAINHAKSLRFKESSEGQCGKIKYKFEAQ